jgi:hypothetical protein
MRLRTPIPSEFETLITDLFEYRDETDGLPRPSHPFSINSLGAAWEVAANARPAPRQSTPLDEHRRRTRYDEDHGDEGPAILLDTQRILSELGLHSGATEAEIAILRREFALRNHPDRVPAELRDIATRRMMIANDLMDQHIARLRRATD